MKRELPSRPSLEQLRHQAKDLLNSLKAADPEAIRRIREAHPRWSDATQAQPGARFSLADAQLVLAREYGFATWPKLKAHVDSLAAPTTDPFDALKEAFHNDDAALVRRLLQEHPQFKAKINDPTGPFDSPPITFVRSREMLDVLLNAGADINAKSRWWAGGFGLLHSAKPDLATYAIQRGAVVDVHAAARLGMIDKLRELVSSDPELVHARGGDGQTPLHFASTVEIAKYLLDHGADINARDIDHESTPAQWMIRERQDIARDLVQCGCKTDLLMSAALGDLDLIRKHLDSDPDCIRMRVNDEWFPKRNHKSGGTIYQWALGWHVSAHDVAKQFGHDDAFALLMERSPSDVKLLAACWQGDEATVTSLLKEHPDAAQTLLQAYQRHIADAARNNNTATVNVMLAAGLPVDARGQHGATPLHWSAFHGNAEMARAILAHNPPLEQRDADFNSTPLGWAIHGSVEGWYCKTGDYAGTVEALLNAGAKPPDKIGGSERVRDILRRHGMT
jgi:ankyrin repeat protein